MESGGAHFYFYTSIFPVRQSGGEETKLAESGERQRSRETESKRHIDRKTKRETERETDRKRNRETKTKTARY